MSGSGVLSALAGIVVSIVVRRALGPVAIGQVNWNIAALSYLNLAANPGLQAVGQREMARHPAATQELASLVSAIGLLLAGVSYGLVILVALIEPRGAAVSWLLIWQGLSVFVSAGNLEWVMKAHERMVAPSLVSLAVNVLQVPAILCLVRGPQDVLVYAVCGLPFLLAANGFNLWYLHRHRILRVSRLRFSFRGAKALLGETWPFALSYAAAMVSWNSGTVILGFTDGDLAVGLYGTAARLIVMPTIISGALLNAYYPVLARMHGAPREAARTAEEFLTLLAWAGLPLAALGWACGQHLVDMMFGPKFHASGAYFEWLCLIVGLSFLNIGIHAPLLAWGQQRLFLKCSIAVASINLVSSMALIPAFGPRGAVAAAVIAEASAVVLVARARHRLGFGAHSLLAPLLSPLACSAAVALAIAQMPGLLAAHWWAMTMLAAVVLGGCMLICQPRMATAGLRLLGRG